MEEYISVSEYARLLGKDTGNVRKMLISGRIPGKNRASIGNRK